MIFKRSLTKSTHTMLRSQNSTMKLKKVLWQSETLVSGITSATNTFLFNKNSFYYAKDENGKFVGFESEVESNQHKADLFKLLSKQFDNQLVSIKNA